MKSKGQLSLEFLLLIMLYLATATGILKLYDRALDLVARGNMKVASVAIRSLVRAAEVARTFKARYFLPPLCSWYCSVGRVAIKCKKSSASIPLNCIEGKGSCMIITKGEGGIYAESCLSS